MRHHETRITGDVCTSIAIAVCDDIFGFEKSLQVLAAAEHSAREMLSDTQILWLETKTWEQIQIICCGETEEMAAALVGAPEGTDEALDEIVSSLL